MTSFFRKNSSQYNPNDLVSFRAADHPGWEFSDTQIICDIDKTWLETRFENIFGLAKIVFEKAQDKITVEGASEVLSSTRWGDSSLQGVFPRPLHFVSSSPPQLRSIFEEKMSLDYLDWTSDTFKDQSYNVRRGRWDLLTQHVAYKSIAIINILSNIQVKTQLLLLGDNAEADPYIYLGLNLLLNKQLDREGFIQYMQFKGVEQPIAEKVAKRVKQLPDHGISLIAIRNLQQQPPITMQPLTDPIFWFHDYFDLAIKLASQNLLSIQQVEDLSRIFHNKYAFTIEHLIDTCYQHKNEFTQPEFSSFIQKLQTIVPDYQSKIKPTQPTSNQHQSLTQNDILELAREWQNAIEQGS